MIFFVRQLNIIVLKVNFSTYSEHSNQIWCLPHVSLPDIYLALTSTTAGTRFVYFHFIKMSFVEESIAIALLVMMQSTVFPIADVHKINHQACCAHTRHSHKVKSPLTGATIGGLGRTHLSTILRALHRPTSPGAVQV